MKTYFSEKKKKTDETIWTPLPLYDPLFVQILKTRTPPFVMNT